MGLEVGLLASAGRGFSPPTCIVLYCIVVGTIGSWQHNCCAGYLWWIRWPIKMLFLLVVYCVFRVSWQLLGCPGPCYTLPVFFQLGLVERGGQLSFGG